jgi:SnoaL-like domain
VSLARNKHNGRVLRHQDEWSRSDTWYQTHSHIQTHRRVSLLSMEAFSGDPNARIGGLTSSLNRLICTFSQRIAMPPCLHAAQYITNSICRYTSARVLSSAADLADYPRGPSVLAPQATNRVKKNESAAARAEAVPSTPLAANDSIEGVIHAFFDAFNRRDLQQMADTVADDCEHCNLAYAKPYPKGRQAVVQFYKSFVDAVPRSARFVIEDTTGTNSSGTIGVIWCASWSCIYVLTHRRRILCLS